MKAIVQAVHRREIRVGIKGRGVPWVTYYGDGAIVRAGSVVEVERIPGTPSWEFVRVVTS